VKNNKKILRVIFTLVVIELAGTSVSYQYIRYEGEEREKLLACFGKHTKNKACI